MIQYFSNPDLKIKVNVFVVCKGMGSDKGGFDYFGFLANNKKKEVLLCDSSTVCIWRVKRK